MKLEMSTAAQSGDLIISDAYEEVGGIRIMVFLASLLFLVCLLGLFGVLVYSFTLLQSAKSFDGDHLFNFIVFSQSSSVQISDYFKTNYTLAAN